MNLGEHFRITSGALKNWLIAQLQDSIAVGLLWLIGLYALKVPWAPLWALLAATLQVVPHLGPVLGRHWSCSRRDFSLGRLGASSLRAHALRRNRRGGWLPVATLHHEARGQGADLGFAADSDRAGHSDSVLGSAAGPAAAGGCVRLQDVARKAEAAHGFLGWPIQSALWLEWNASDS